MNLALVLVTDKPPPKQKTPTMDAEKQFMDSFLATTVRPEPPKPEEKAVAWIAKRGSALVALKVGEAEGLAGKPLAMKIAGLEYKLLKPTKTH